MSRCVVTALVGLAVTACGDGMTQSSGYVTTSVVVAPVPNAPSVSRGDTIRMWLDMPMDSASCVIRFMLHVGDSTGAVVTGHMSFAGGYREMMFVPDSLLRPATRYFAHMRDSVLIRSSMHDNGMGGMTGGGWMMMNGQMPGGMARMADGVGWSFTTGN